MDPSQSLSDLLAGLSAKIAFHGREEKTCAEREAHFREQRTFHAAELERATRCHEALLAAAHTADEINARPAPIELPAQDLGSPSRPKVTRMVDLVLADLAPDLRFGAKQVVAEIKRRFGLNLSRPADTGASRSSSSAGPRPAASTACAAAGLITRHSTPAGRRGRRGHPPGPLLRRVGV